MLIVHKDKACFKFGKTVSVKVDYLYKTIYFQSSYNKKLKKIGTPQISTIIFLPWNM